ncbi:MAG: DUF962 domain-containing protein [Vicinamibacteria bacterium]
MSPVLRGRFSDYAAFHATRGNQACHYVGIPLIVLTLLAALTKLEIVPAGSVTLTAAELLLALVTLYYLTLDRPLALMMLAVSLAFAAIGRAIPLWPAIGLFVVGWVLQFIGHYVYEKKAPAFYQNLTHLLVGPLWILAKATGRS